jgi:hypothetical protein
MSYLSIPHGGDGSAKYPFLLTFAPSSSPGHVANPNSVAKDMTTGIFYSKTGAGSTDWTPITGSLAYETDEDYYKARASTLMASPRLTCWWWDDFLEPLSEKWTSNLNSFATKYDACGVATMSAGTESGVGYLYLGGSAASSGADFPEGTDGTWYMCFRGAVAGTTQTQAYSDMGMFDLNGNVQVSFGDASQFVHDYSFYSGSAGQVLTTTAIDTSAHVLELYRNAGTTYMLVDEVVIGSHTSVFPALPSSVRFRLGTTATTSSKRSINVDFACFAVGGNNPRTIT